MNTNQIILSPLPRPTWGWLHINEAKAGWPEGKSVAYAHNPLAGVALPAGITVEENATGQGHSRAVPYILQNTAGLVAGVQNHGLQFSVAENAQAEQPLVLDYALSSQNPLLANRLHIIAARGSRATVVVRYHSENGAHAQHAGFVSAEVEENAHLTLIQVQLLNSGSTHIDGIQATVAANGELNLLLCEAGGAEVVAGADITLAGEGAQAELNALYLAGGSAKRDMNYRMEYAAPNTTGKITARGALAGSARKTLKSTIDFVRGATGAKGTEEESVLVLSDKVVNISTPLLLCGEDNVEGQHATNIGRPDANKLYFLQSRGFTETAARQLLVEASLTPMLNALPLESLREEVAAKVQEVLGNDA